MMDSREFAGKAAVVTGAARGMGQRIAERLAEAGARVFLLDRSATVHDAADALRARGCTATAIVVDVTDEAAVAGAVARVGHEAGRLDILVNNAGISLRRDGRRITVEMAELAEWNLVMSVNLTSVFLMCRACVPLMRRTGGGRIVSIASQAGRTRSEVTSAFYSASKAGIIAFSRQLALEVGDAGITVNCVAPGAIATEMRKVATAEVDAAVLARTPMGRIGTTDDVANAVLHLASGASGFLTGTVADVNGGYFMA